MIKNIMKEIIITLLLCIAIVLILSIVFYDYNPLAKVIPNKIAYSTPEDIQEEIKDEEVKDVLDESINIVYSIDGTDMMQYKKNNNYVSGKANPFTKMPDPEEEQGTSGTEKPTGGTTGSTQNTNNNSDFTNKINSNPDSTGTILNTIGK